MSAGYVITPGAVMSADRRYRYELRRLVDATGYGEIVWYMLNPSTADERENDPTIRRCLDFSRRWGFRSLRVVNLVPLRSANPSTVVRAYRGPPFGGDYFTNMSYQERAVEEADAVVLAWGSHGDDLDGESFMERAQELSDEVWVLGWNRDGTPRHPLYVKADTKPIHATDDSRKWLRS